MEVIVFANTETSCSNAGHGLSVRSINVTVGMDKPLAGLIVVRRLDVDKGPVLRSGILDTLFVISCTTLKK